MRVFVSDCVFVSVGDFMSVRAYVCMCVRAWRARSIHNKSFMFSCFKI
jgi:hypothetical protein